MKKVLFVVVAIVVVGGGIFWLMQGSDSDKAKNAQEGTTITYTDNGFSPDSLRVASGTEVTIKNNSAGDLQFSSDVHPEHTENAELNTATVGPGENITITPTDKGTWGYHDHLHSDRIGTIIVE